MPTITRKSLAEAIGNRLWHRSAKGNAWRRMPDGKVITVFRRGDLFTYCFSTDDGTCYADDAWDTEAEAKEVALIDLNTN